MKRIMKLATAAATALVLAGGLVPSAEAACVNPALLRTADSAANVSRVWTPGYFYGTNTLCTAGFGLCGNGVTYIDQTTGFFQEPLAFSPAYNIILPVTPDFIGSFWVLGYGDPGPTANPGVGSTPANTDNGTFNFPILYNPYIDTAAAGGGRLNKSGFVSTTWNASPNIDGCPTEDAEADPGDLLFGSCVCVLFTDQWNGSGFFALASNVIDPAGSTNLNLGTKTGNNAVTPTNEQDPIKLFPIPAPQVTNSVKQGATGVDVTVQTAFPGGGLYQLGGCDCEPLGVIPHVRSFPNATLVSGSPDAEPNDHPGGTWPERNIAAGAWAPAPGPPGIVPFGANALLNLTCSTDESLFIANQICFPNLPGLEFCTPVLSTSALEVECGPNLAIPDGGPAVTPGHPGRGRPDRPGRDR